MDQEKHIATFEAWIPPIKSAILAGGDGGQVKFEIAASDLGAVTALIENGQHKVLHVSVFEA